MNIKHLHRCGIIEEYKIMKQLLGIESQWLLCGNIKMIYDLGMIKEKRNKVAEWIKMAYNGPLKPRNGLCIMCKKAAPVTTEHICLSCFVYMSDFQIFLVSRKKR